MVHLNRIYTRTGDGGETTLGDGTRVAKTSSRVRAMGAVDEVNAALGTCAALTALGNESRRWLLAIQNDLFDLGADLCVPESPESGEHPSLRIQPGQVQRLEQWIDNCTSRLQPLDSFVLPGGSPASSLLHQARAICRRAEIDVTALGQAESINPRMAIYLNRLSDLLFVMARMENDGGRSDVPWRPGENACS